MKKKLQAKYQTGGPPQNLYFGQSQNFGMARYNADAMAQNVGAATAALNASQNQQQNENVMSAGKDLFSAIAKKKGGFKFQTGGTCPQGYIMDSRTKVCAPDPNWVGATPGAGVMAEEYLPGLDSAAAGEYQPTDMLNPDGNAIAGSGVLQSKYLTDPNAINAATNTLYKTSGTTQNIIGNIGGQAKRAGEVTDAVEQGADVASQGRNLLSPAPIAGGVARVAGAVAEKMASDNNVATVTKGENFATGFNSIAKGVAAGSKYGPAGMAMGAIYGAAMIGQAKRENELAARNVHTNEGILGVANREALKEKWQGQEAGYGYKSSPNMGMLSTGAYKVKTGGSRGQAVPTGAKKLDGGYSIPIGPNGEVKYIGRKHAADGGNDGGINLPDGITQVEGEETEDTVKKSNGEPTKYFFSAFLKRFGKSFAKRHEELVEAGADQAAIQALAKEQEAVAYKEGEKDRSPETIASARYGGIQKHQTGNFKFDLKNSKVEGTAPNATKAPQSFNDINKVIPMPKNPTPEEGEKYWDDVQSYCAQFPGAKGCYNGTYWDKVENPKDGEAVNVFSEKKFKNFPYHVQAYIASGDPGGMGLLKAAGFPATYERSRRVVDPGITKTFLVDTPEEIEDYMKKSKELDSKMKNFDKNYGPGTWIKSKNKLGGYSLTRKYQTAGEEKEEEKMLGPEVGEPAAAVPANEETVNYGSEKFKAVPSLDENGNPIEGLGSDARVGDASSYKKYLVPGLTRDRSTDTAGPYRYGNKTIGADDSWESVIVDEDPYSEHSKARHAVMNNSEKAYQRALAKENGIEAGIKPEATANADGSVTVRGTESPKAVQESDGIFRVRDASGKVIGRSQDVTVAESMAQNYLMAEEAKKAKAEDTSTSQEEKIEMPDGSYVTKEQYDKTMSGVKPPVASATPEASANAQSNANASNITVRDQNQANAAAPSAQTSVASTSQGGTNNSGQNATNTAAAVQNNTNNSTANSTSTAGTPVTTTTTTGTTGTTGTPGKERYFSKEDITKGGKGVSKSMEKVPAGQGDQGTYFGKVSNAQFDAFKANNPWFDFSAGFDPKKRDFTSSKGIKGSADVARFQEEYNKHVGEGNTLQVDGKLGEQTATAMLMFTDPAAPTPGVTEEKPKEEVKEKPKQEPCAEGTFRNDAGECVPMVDNINPRSYWNPIPGMTQYISPVWAATHPYQAAAGISGATAYTGPNPRVNYNQEIASNIDSNVAATNMVRGMSGPQAGVMQALNNSRNAKDLDIRRAETTANVGLIKDEQDRATKVSMFNAQNETERQKFNKETEVSEKRYKREDTLAYMQQIGLVTAGNYKDKMQYDATERLANALDETGSYTRFTLEEALRKDPAFKNMSQRQLKDFASAYYNARERSNEKTNVGGSGNRNEQKTGGARKYTSRLGELSSKKSLNFSK